MKLMFPVHSGNLQLMKKEILVTKDGSHTLSIPAWKVSYHSLHGAVQESRHVFIREGLLPLLPDAPLIRIFEMGFGTGLNALLSLMESTEAGVTIEYTSVEAFPLLPEEVAQLNYGRQLGAQELFEQLHAAAWNERVTISEKFALHKLHQKLEHYTPAKPFHLCYYDAFAPAAQPELWTGEIFKKIFSLLLPGGRLVTYCSKSVVRKAMQSAGLVVEKLPGPPGKREMVRATRPER
jgi:tRNA U34 5-methylaminomethyl-2-thiouridine-forming methyltransferase MnmC